MTNDHHSLPQSLGSSGADVVLTDHLQHAGPGQTGDDGRSSCAQGDGRQDHVAEPVAEVLRAPTGQGEGWQIMLVQPEHTQNEHQPQHEIRDGYAQHGEEHADVVNDGVLFESRDDAQGNAYAYRYEGGKDA